MKLDKVVKHRLVLMFWGAVGSFVLYIAVTQDRDPLAVAYMAKVNATQVATK